jgi:polyisoprenoid-binding protein YceI
MKKIILLVALFTTSFTLFAQKKTTTSATVSFDATTPKDGLPKAENKTVIGSINTQTGEVAFEAAVNNFSFSNPSMQQHFNGEKWMNSEQFPKFTFTGKITNIHKVKFNKNGTYKVTVNGDLTIKGITRKTNLSGTIKVTDGKIKIASTFSIKLADYNISGQPVDAGKVAKEPKIAVSAEF